MKTLEGHTKLIADLWKSLEPWQCYNPAAVKYDNERIVDIYRPGDSLFIELSGQMLSVVYGISNNSDVSKVGSCHEVWDTERGWEGGHQIGWRFNRYLTAAEMVRDIV